MTRVLEASATSDGKVMVGSLEITAAEILSEGAQASEGILIIDGDKAYYLPSSASDVKTTIEKTIALVDDLASALTTIANALTAIGAGMTGPTTATPPTLATSVSSITSKVTELNTTKSELETLKGALI